MMNAEPKTDIWMPLYVGDYLADTPHLDAERSGCYLHWLMYYWRRGPLPDDLEKLASIGRLRSPDAPRITRELLKDFFILSADGCWHQKRADSEKAKWCDKRLRAKEKAIKASRSRWKVRDAPSITQGMLDGCPSPSPSTAHEKTKALARSVPPEELAGTLPLVDGTEHMISRGQIRQWSQAYPGIDVTVELRRFKVWLDANPKRRKTRQGIARAIVGWLSRAQDGSTANGGNYGRLNSTVELLRQFVVEGENSSGNDGAGAGSEGGQGNHHALCRSPGEGAA